MIRSRPDITLSMSPSSRTESALSSTSASSVPRALKPLAGDGAVAVAMSVPSPLSSSARLLVVGRRALAGLMRRNYYLIG